MKIDDLLHIYLREANQNCLMVNRCFVGLQTTLNNENRDGAGEIFFWLRSILVHSASVSLIFWPNQKRVKIKERGDRLREIMNLSELEFLSSRKFRDQIVHMDEKIESWFLNTESKDFATRVSAPRGMLGSIAEQDILEQFIPNEGVIIFRGEEYDLKALNRVIVKVYERTTEVLDKTSN